MPEKMQFPDAELWMPLARVPGLAARKRDERFGMQVFGRLAPGVSRQQAQSEFTTIATRLEQDFPGTNKNIGAPIMTFNERFYAGPIRLVHHAEIISIEGESYRKREAELAQKRKQEPKPKR